MAARILGLTQLSHESPKIFLDQFRLLRRYADTKELIALYSGLPLYNSPDMLVEDIVDGLRTNVKAEFEAIAHGNPFPAEQFEENPWNNMVLKSLFIGIMLNPIYGIDSRANKELATILRDYAHERWAANRIISPELWRCIGPFASNDNLDDFNRVVNFGEETEVKAIALALNSAPNSDGKIRLTNKIKKYISAIDNGKLTWDHIANEMIKKSIARTSKMNFEVELQK